MPLIPVENRRNRETLKFSVDRGLDCLVRAVRVEGTVRTRHSDSRRGTPTFSCHTQNTQVQLRDSLVLLCIVEALLCWVDILTWAVGCGAMDAAQVSASLYHHISVGSSCQPSQIVAVSLCLSFKGSRHVKNRVAAGGSWCPSPSYLH